MIQHDSSRVSSISQHIPLLLTSLQHFPPVANKKNKQTKYQDTIASKN